MSDVSAPAQPPPVDTSNVDKAPDPTPATTSGTTSGTSDGATDPVHNGPEQSLSESEFAAKYLTPAPDLDYNGTLLGYRLACNSKTQNFNMEQLSRSMHHLANPERYPQPGQPQRAFYGYSPLEIFSFASNPRYLKYYEHLMGESGLPEHLLTAISAYELGNTTKQPTPAKTNTQSIAAPSDSSITDNDHAPNADADHPSDDDRIRARLRPHGNTPSPQLS
ncbi:hypothetical protein FISHEDRAFT_59301 [Fistulina hepatica ATCC 64428]|uniref:Uncharacterized protein n=1 Tax=Fistulina hepatica ATCC 64428 TaxID=1128425 RepID=A0A0D7AAK7_9AGAR|nr:hypothetical protein FISHEDRAFT_59301 [Fistulina hepatica ATCC 64428]